MADQYGNNVDGEVWVPAPDIAKLPQVGDTVTLQGVVIARNSYANWISVKLPCGSVVAIDYKEPAP